MFAEATHVSYILVTKPRHDEKVMTKRCETLLDAVRHQDQQDLIASVVMEAGILPASINVSLHFIGSSLDATTSNQVMALATYVRRDRQWVAHHVTGNTIDAFDDGTHDIIKSLLSFFDHHFHPVGEAVGF